MMRRWVWLLVLGSVGLVWADEYWVPRQATPTFLFQSRTAGYAFEALGGETTGWTQGYVLSGDRNGTRLIRRIGSWTTLQRLLLLQFATTYGTLMP